MNPFQPHSLHFSAVRRWLSFSVLLLVLMVALGGVTRLTESGLSIVEWKLVSGTLPPMGDAAWEQEFDAYKTSPQYEQVNRGFGLSDFKQIFWLEYLHRLLGRFIGFVVAGGTLYYGMRRFLPRALLLRMVWISALIGAQGTVGWIMVASGLENEPRVEPIKLALHLLLAFSVFGALLWTRWQVLGIQAKVASAGIYWAVRALLALVIAQIFLGALVAGLRAGLTYNTYPLMDGQFIPEGLHLLTPWWKNHLENVMTVQFQHRMGALAVVGATLGFVAYAWRTLPPRLLHGLLATLALQFGLGVATLLSVVELWLASAHQVVALLFTGMLLQICYLTHRKTHNQG